ncbi:MAG: signal recognition particle receptor subunit alpha, partial [Nostoc sp.]
METILITSDVGVAATQALLEQIRNRVKRHNLNDTAQLKEALKLSLLEMLAPLEKPLDITQKPYVIMMTGVNGAGKTTTIGKLANLFQ